MDNKYKLDSILNAIDELNSEKKTKIISSNFNDEEKTQKKIKPNEELLPITEKIIQEAENYSNKFKDKTSISTLRTEEKLEITKLEKNNLKTISDLQEILNDLKKEVQILNTSLKNKNLINIINNDLKKNEDDILILDQEYQENFTNLVNEEHLISDDSVESLSAHENVEHLINENNDDFLIGEDEDIHSSSIKTLRLQDSLLKNFEKNEEKLRLKIVDLEQDIFLLKNDKKKIQQSSILTEIEKEFDPSILKKDRESLFYKENYERLIIVNSDFNKKLKNAKEQIIVYEENIRDLESGFRNLSNILSKNSIIKFKEPLLKITPELDSPEQNSRELKFSTLHTTDKKEK